MFSFITCLPLFRRPGCLIKKKKKKKKRESNVQFYTIKYEQQSAIQYTGLTGWVNFATTKLANKVSKINKLLTKYTYRTNRNTVH